MKLDGFAKFAWGVLVYNLGVILWGAFVRATGSGAGCGSHWPLCNGDVVPRAPEVETLIEFTHRATSGIALLLVIGLYLWARRRHAPGNAVRTFARLSLIFIIIEALLGAGLVLFELVAENDSWMRAFSMIAHLVNTFVLVAMLSLTAWYASGHPPARWTSDRRSAALLATGAVALLVVGGTGAIAALGDTLFPAETLAEGIRDSFSRESHPLLQLRKYHPLLAIIAGLGVVAIARWVARTSGAVATRPLAAAVVGLYLVQLAAGTVNIVLLAPVAMQLVHLLLADFLWIAYVLLAASALAAEDAPAPRNGRRASSPEAGRAAYP